MDAFLTEISKRLEKALAAAFVEIQDFSQKHAGHLPAGKAQLGGTHLEITLVSPYFAGKTRLQRERLLQETLRAELESGRIHALVLKLLSPDETSGQNP